MIRKLETEKKTGLKLSNRKFSHTIYHSREFGNFKTIRLNLKAISALLDTPVKSFDDLTDSMRDLLERRFASYCDHGKARFGPGKQVTFSMADEEIPPCLDNLPDKPALALALKEVSV